MQNVSRLMLSGIAAAGLLAAPAAFAQSSDNSVSFTFAPPPITALVGANESASRVNLTYLQIDVPDDPFRAAGVDFVSRKGNSSGSGGFAFTGRGMGLWNDSETTSGFLLGGGLGPEIYFGERNNTILFVGISGDFMYLYSSTAFADVTTTGGMLGVQAALQHHVEFGDNVSFIPYVAVSATSSSFTTTIETSSTSSSTDSSSSSTSTTIGFDLKLSGISLGALANTGGDNNVKMFRIGFNF